MFRNTFQNGFLSVFHSIGSKPLQIWDTKVKDGNIKRISDEDMKSLALDIRGVNVETCYITAPNAPCKSLGIKMPFLTIVVKNLCKHFSYEVQILDDQNQLRRFRCSSYQTRTRVSNFMVSMPMGLNHGWNQIQMNLAEFTRNAFGTNYTETVRVTVYANCRLRNVYFSDRFYSDDEKPQEFKFICKEEKPRRKPRVYQRTEIPKIIITTDETIRPTSPVSHPQSDIKVVLNEIFDDIFVQ